MDDSLVALFILPIELQYLFLQLSINLNFNSS